MTKLEVTAHETRNVRYYEGELIDRWVTEDDNLIIRVKDVKILENQYGCKVTRKCNLNELNFLVPKRRTRVFKKCKQLKVGEKLVIKLMQEMRSKKFAVSEIGEI